MAWCVLVPNIHTVLVYISVSPSSSPFWIVASSASAHRSYHSLSLSLCSACTSPSSGSGSFFSASHQYQLTSCGGSHLVRLHLHSAQSAHLNRSKSIIDQDESGSGQCGEVPNVRGPDGQPRRDQAAGRRPVHAAVARQPLHLRALHYRHLYALEPFTISLMSSNRMRIAEQTALCQKSNLLFLCEVMQFGFGLFEAGISRNSFTRRRSSKTTCARVRCFAICYCLCGDWRCTLHM